MSAVYGFGRGGESPGHNHVGVTFSLQSQLAHRFSPLFIFLSSVVPRRRDPHPAGRSSSSALFVTLRATSPLLQCQPLRDVEDASCHPRDGPQVRRLREPSGVGRLPVASSRRAWLVSSQWVFPSRDVPELVG